MNSEQMTLKLTIRKKETIKKLCWVLLSTDTEKPAIRLVVQLLGNMVAASEAVPFGQLYSQHAEKKILKH